MVLWRVLCVSEVHGRGGALFSSRVAVVVSRVANA